MSTATPDRLRDLFTRALACPSDQLDAFLARECGGDTHLRRDIELLLAHDQEAAPGFLSPHGLPALDLVEGDGDLGDDLLAPGNRVGRYTIEGVLSSGGMGTVYAARQANPERTVALKFLHAWTWSRSARKRFEFETQTLARLNHPHIAQVYEAGEFEGRPYFAMELVSEAMPIDEYALRRRQSLREKLRLFVHVCAAVQHGHQRGVIHRDLKPSNILVDGDGHVKVIDFGVAKATDSDIAVTTIRTNTGQVIGTLRYMSPEQCGADPLELDVRSDVYALGVVLYELTCGKLPYDIAGASLTQAARIICECEPIAPHAVARGMSRDVELIILKALQKQREGRYRSAGDLADDLERFLGGEHVEARPPTPWSRMTRWIGRHPIVSSSAASAAIGAVIVTTALLVAERLGAVPWRLHISPAANEVWLLAADGSPLHSWKSPGHHGFTAYSDIIDGVVEGRPRRLGLVGFPVDIESEWAGQVCAFDVGAREYERPLWCAGIAANALPVDPQRTLGAKDFSARSINIWDIFQGNDDPEIVLTFVHVWSRRCVQVRSFDGVLLYQVWTDGGVASLYWIPDSRQLLVAGKNEHPGPWRWATDHPTMGPFVVWAVRPAIGEIHAKYVCTGVNPDCVEPEWYRYLAPLDRCVGIESLAVAAPEPQYGSQSTLFRVLFTVPRPGREVWAGWVINNRGERVVHSWFKNDDYRLEESDLIPIEELDLVPFEDLQFSPRQQ